MDGEKTTVYKTTIERIFEKLAVDKGRRSPREDLKIKQFVYEAVAKEILGFIYESLDPLKQLSFKADIEETNGDLNKISNLIVSYLQIIPAYRVRLEERLKVFETALYRQLLYFSDDHGN